MELRVKFTCRSEHWKDWQNVEFSWWRINRSAETDGK